MYIDNFINYTTQREREKENTMAKVLEALIAKGRRAKRPQEQKEIAFGLADLSTHGQWW